MSYNSSPDIRGMEPVYSGERAKRLDQNILYAQKLQDALFRNTNVQSLFKDNFIFDRPKDLVGGDFYLIDQVAGQKMVLVGDCTGHGPSGAMLSALCVSILKDLITKYKTLSPSLIIDKALQKLHEMLENGVIHDGMEVTLAFIHESRKEIRYASTGQSMFLYGAEVQRTIKFPHIGFDGSLMHKLKDQVVSYQADTMLYLATDGMKDQFGSETGRRYSAKKMANCFASCWQRSCADQESAIAAQFEAWQGALEDQTDDVLLIGLKL